MMNKKLFGAAAAALVLLNACGGGNAGPEGVTYAVAAAERNWLGTAKGYSFTGEPMALSASVTLTPRDAVLLPALSSSPVERTDIVGQTYVIAQPHDIINREYDYQRSPLRYLGVSGNAAEQVTAMPETATVGASGPLYTMPATSNEFMTFQSVLSWSLEADTPQTAWLCHHDGNRQTPIGGGPSQLNELRLCIKIDPAGTISGFKLG